MEINCRTNKDTHSCPSSHPRPKIFSKTFPPVPITSFDVLSDLQQISFGLGNGAVMLFEGSLIKDSKPRQTLILPQGKIVTGVHFKENKNLFMKRRV